MVMGSKCTSPEKDAETPRGMFGDTLFLSVTTTPIALQGQEIGSGAFLVTRPTPQTRVELHWPLAITAGTWRTDK